MQTAVDWIRSAFVLYFLMMIVLYFSAGESYKKFIRFFMGLVLALTLISPVLRLFGKTDALRDGISYERFRQTIEEAQLDVTYMEEKETAVYRRHYERALEKQFLQAAKEKQLGIHAVRVTLGDDFVPRQVCIQAEAVGDGELLKDYLCSVYELEERAVRVE